MARLPSSFSMLIHKTQNSLVCPNFLFCMSKLSYLWRSVTSWSYFCFTYVIVTDLLNVLLYVTCWSLCVVSLFVSVCLIEFSSLDFFVRWMILPHQVTNQVCLSKTNKSCFSYLTIKFSSESNCESSACSNCLHFFIVKPCTVCWLLHITLLWFSLCTFCCFTWLLHLYVITLHTSYHSISKVLFFTSSLTHFVYVLLNLRDV